MNRTASANWPHKEVDPQRLGILAAADRLLSGKPKHSSGNLSIVQLAQEAKVKYWVIAQKHTDLRDHFQRLAVPARKAAATIDADQNPFAVLQRDYKVLRDHCEGLEQLVKTYATIINELTLENATLRTQIASTTTTVTPIDSRRPQHPR